MTSKNKILIVDDDETLCDTLEDVLSSEGYRVQWVGNGTDALKLIDQDAIDIVLLDLLLPGMDGLEVLKKILRKKTPPTVIMMSGHGTIRTAVEATKLGAYDFLEKPLEKERVLLTVRNAVEKSVLLKEKDILLSETKERYRMVGTSPAMKTIYQLIDRVAPKNVTVLITGESGTGKELVARAIHINSPRAALPFIEVNCAAVPETLIESELFGHVKGAFTGATTDKQGKFQLADGGTLFLDEIGDLSPMAQAKVLRAIETGEIEKVGSEKLENVDIRMISATNKHLEQMTEKGSFREDLFHRINVIEIPIPPLRERPGDILPLIDHFLDKYCHENNVGKKELTPDAEAFFLSHAWPGNVRELRNFAEKLVVLVDDQTISGQHVARLLDFPDFEIELSKAKTFKEAKMSFEKSFILHALSENKWNIVRTAETLNMPRSLLYSKMEKYGIKVDSEKVDK